MPNVNVRSRHSRATIIAMVVLPVACGGGDAMGPDENGGRAPAFDMAGTWRLYNGSGSGTGLQSWWLFNLTQSGGSVSGTTEWGLEIFTYALGRSVTQFFDPRPVQVQAEGSAVVLSFNMDEDDDIESLQGQLSDGAMQGTGWRAQRVTRPAAPTNLAATVVSATEVRLTWTDNSSNETGFRIDLRCCGGDFEGIGEVGLDAQAVVVFDLQTNVPYDFRVSAVWSDRWESRDWTLASAPSNVASATPAAAAVP